MTNQAPARDSLAAATPRLQRHAGDRDGPGVTPDTISIGVGIDEAAASRAAASGVRADAGDIARFAQVAADVINRQGGIAGRRVNIEVFRWSQSNFGTAVCAHFTEDVPVFTVIINGAATKYLKECFRDHAMPVIDVVGSEGDRTWYDEEFPNFFSVSSVRLDRLAEALVDALAARGFFPQGEPIGLVTYEHEAYQRAIDTALVPALARHGRALAATWRLTHPNHNMHEQQAQAASGVAAFRRAGIRRVLIFEGRPWASGNWGRAAQDHPGVEFSYGMTSLSGPSLKAVSESESVTGDYFIPRSILERSLIVGWSPLGDLIPKYGLQEMPLQARKWIATFERHGVRFSDGCCAHGSALSVAERLRFLQAALAGAEVVNLDTLRAGVDSLGARYEPLLTYATHFGPGRHDGAARFRYLQWDARCPCLRYSGGLRPLP